MKKKCHKKVSGKHLHPIKRIVCQNRCYERKPIKENN